MPTHESKAGCESADRRVQLNELWVPLVSTVAVVQPVQLGIFVSHKQFCQEQVDVHSTSTSGTCNGTVASVEQPNWVCERSKEHVEAYELAPRRNTRPGRIRTAVPAAVFCLADRQSASTGAGRRATPWPSGSGLETPRVPGVFLNHLGLSLRPPVHTRLCAFVSLSRYRNLTS